MATLKNSHFLCLVLLALMETGCGKEKTTGNGAPDYHHNEKGPIGVDALHSLDALPKIRQGVNAVEFSSYDREGYNDSGFTGEEEFLYADGDGASVLVDVIGPGCIYDMFLAWLNTPLVPEEVERDFLEQVGNVQIFLDGAASPVIDLPVSAIFDKQHAPFLESFVFSPDESSLGAVSYLPIAFRNSCVVRVTGGPGPMFFHQIWIHRYWNSDGFGTFTGGEDLSGVKSLRAGIGKDPKDRSLNKKREGKVHLSPSVRSKDEDKRVLIFDHTSGGRIQSIHLKTSADGVSDSNILRNLWIEMSWDGLTAVSSPLALFFAQGHRNTKPENLPGVAVAREVPVRSLLVGENDSGELYSFFPMPFADSARISLIYYSDGEESASSEVEVSYRIEYRDLLPEEHPGISEGYFQTQYRFVNRRDFGSSIPLGEDYLILEAGGSGHYAGVVIMADDTQETVLEGDERAYIDGSKTPQIYGTATETYFQGSWYFKEEPFSLPLSGAPVIIMREGVPSGRFDLTMYRFHLTDLVPFHDSIRFGIMHGGINNIPVNYSSLAFFYAVKESSLLLTDEFDMGNVRAEADHSLKIEEEQGEIPALIAYYEGDLDGSQIGQYEEASLADSTPEEAEQLNMDIVLHPPETPPPEESPQSVRDDGRELKLPHQFVARIDPANHGVKLRRRFDQGEERCKARILVDGFDAGIWYYAGTNPHKRWRDDDFEIPPALAKNKNSITIRIEPLSGTWNAYHYWVFSYVYVH